MTVSNDHSSKGARHARRYGVAGIVLCIVGTLAGVPVDAVLAQQQGNAKPVPTVEGNIEAGKALFEQHCVTCHGPRGRGDGLEIAGATVADLTSPVTQRKLNADLLATIHEGRPGKVMPSWDYRLSNAQSKDVLAYIRTLRKK